MAVTVEAVGGRRGMARFVDVPWHVFDRTRYPQWSPPLRRVTRDLIDPSRDPFYRHADIQLFVASEGKRLLGRVAAVANHAHNQCHQDKVGFFGFFDSVDDPTVARELLAAAEGWLRERGLEVSRGPVSPSLNHECGLLVEGCEVETMLFTPWNPSYYEDLVTGAGYTKAKDLLGYDLPLSQPPAIAERLARLAARAKERTGLTFREGKVRRFAEDLRRFWPLYAEGWKGNWGFVPPNLEEATYLAESLKPLMVPGMCFLAEIKGEPAGFWIVVRNINKIFQKIPSGRLGPRALWHLLVGLRKVKEGRVILFGISEEARKLGLYPVFAHEAVTRAVSHGAVRGDGSWILEDNVDSISPLEAMGARQNHRWRIYDKDLTR